MRRWPRRLPRAPLIRPAALLTALLVAAAPLPAAADAVEGLRALQALDARVATAGYRLAVAGAPFCAPAPAQLGLALHDLSQYAGDAQADARAAFGLGDWPAVLAVVPGGPADRAGVRVGDELTAIDGTPVPAQTGTRSYARMEQLAAMLEAAEGDGSVRLALRRAGQPLTTTIAPARACPTRFQMLPSDTFNAEADGIYVQITSRFALFAVDDAELAALIAHELSHNILRHRARLDAAGMKRGLAGMFGRNARLSRAAELEADRMAVYLMESAGYPTTALVTVWTRLRREHGLGILRNPDHPGEKERIAAMQAEIDRIARLKATGQPLRPDFSGSGLAGSAVP